MHSIVYYRLIFKLEYFSLVLQQNVNSLYQMCAEDEDIRSEI